MVFFNKRIVLLDKNSGVYFQQLELYIIIFFIFVLSNETYIRSAAEQLIRDNLRQTSVTKRGFCPLFY